MNNQTEHTSTLPKVKLDLTQIDGNAFLIMGAFRKQASRQGWTNEEITHVLDDAMSLDYNHLIWVISQNITMEESEEF